MQPRERFRKSFVLLSVVAYTALFIAMIWGFVEALLMAAVFAGVLWPLFCRLKKAFRGQATAASLTTLLIALLVVVIPLVFLLGMIAEQAVELTGEITPWIEQQISDTSGEQLPAWLPFAEQLQPHAQEISAKLGEFAGNAAVFLASSLGTVTEGTMGFFLNLFVMLYAMFFFLISGPPLVATIMGYLPLSQGDRDHLLRVSASVGRATIKGTLIIGIIQGTLGGIGFAVAGIESAVFWGAIMAVLSVLPGIGATLVWAPAVVYLFLTGHTLVGLGLLVWSAGIVGTIDNVLRPILVGRDTAMPDLLILLATLGGLSLFGASGLVLGPMLAALFLALLTIYSQVFAAWLSNDEGSDA